MPVRREIKTSRLEFDLTEESESASAAATGNMNELQLCVMMR